MDTEELENYVVDEGIRGLVEDLEKAGFKTLASCQYHEDGRAWVSVFGEPSMVLPEGWEKIQHSQLVWRIRTTSSEGTHEKEIEELQNKLRSMASS